MKKDKLDRKQEAAASLAARATEPGGIGGFQGRDVQQRVLEKRNPEDSSGPPASWY